MRFIEITTALAVLLFACGPDMHTSEIKARTALDVLADIVDPAYAQAMQGCIDTEEIAMRAGEQDAATPEQTEIALVAISARCHHVRDAFEQIRKSHDLAIGYVEDGRYDAALVMLDDMRDAWRQLRNGGDHDGG